jgi:hypothetical protein
VLDELGLDRQAALGLKLKAALHQKILWLVKQKGKIKIKVKGVGKHFWVTRYSRDPCPAQPPGLRLRAACG